MDEISHEKEVDQVGVCTELQWESPLSLKSIVKYPNPILRAPNQAVGVFGPPLQKLANEMFAVMYQDEGVGLAAPQIGVNIRLMVFNATGVKGEGEEMVLANPRIIKPGKKSSVEEEACLSFNLSDTTVKGEVERPELVKIKAQDVDGKPVRCTIDGWPARIFQHEFDHLQGVLFPDRISDEHLAREREKLEALEAEFAQRGGAPSESVLARLAA